MRTSGCFYWHGTRASMLSAARLAVSAIMLPGKAASTTIRIATPIAASSPKCGPRFVTSVP
jgi:hypothetical protein